MLDPKKPPAVRCIKHGVQKGYRLCIHILISLQQQMSPLVVRQNIGIVLAPTEYDYGYFICSSQREHDKNKPEMWGLKASPFYPNCFQCEKCLVEQQWLKAGEGENAPMVLLSTEVDMQNLTKGIKGRKIT